MALTGGDVAMGSSEQAISESVGAMSAVCQTFSTEGVQVVH